MSYHIEISSVAEVEADSAFLSQVLGLELRLQSGELRFLNAAKGEILLTHEEEVQRSRTLAAKLRELGIKPDTL